jgi:DNA invertase Pin-like site-specific DNA recombinase
MEKYVAYYRVSTEMQEQSGLGLSSQREAISRFVASKQGILVDQFEEVETGTNRRKRVIVYKALELCKQQGAKLIIAKMDRLTRDGVFWSEVKRSGVKCISLDNPEGSEFLADILVVFADAEGKRIKERIKDALRVKIARGETIGNPDKLNIHRAQAVENSIKTRQEMARIKNFQATGVICDFRSAGWSYQRIADRLNGLNFKTSREKSFTSKTVELLYKRYCVA